MRETGSIQTLCLLKVMLELQAAIKLGGPEMKEAHRVLSIIYGARGDNKKSLKELEAYVKLAPDATDIEQLKARIAQLKGKN